MNAAEGLLVKGLDGLVANLRTIARNTPSRAAAALYTEAQIEMTEAKRRTPVLTGALRGTGTVADPVISGSDISVTMSFGGPAVSYAIPVHENLEAHHTPPGQAKYLESVVNESRPYLASRLAARMQLTKSPGTTSASTSTEE
jgi:hypothetical protein